MFFPQAVSTRKMTQLSQSTTTLLTQWFAGIPMRTLTNDTRIAWKVTVLFIHRISFILILLIKDN